MQYSNIKFNYLLKCLILVVCTFGINTDISFAQNETTGPKNIIIFIGDGMGLSQISTEILSHKKPTVFESFKHMGFVKTHSHSSLVTDSGAAATAMATGKKTYNNAIGLDKDSIAVTNLMELAQANNYSTGIIVTSPLTHATPAGFYAHSKHRINKGEIAEQLVQKDIDLLIGGGRDDFNNENSTELYLLDTLKNKGYTILSNNENELPNIQGYGPDSKIILFTSDFLPSGAITGREYFPQYCKTGPYYLRKKEKEGFLLMVESSQLDISLHSNSALEFKAEIHDTEKAIEALLDFARKDGNTLLLVTADHETSGLAIADGKIGRKVDLAFTTNGHTAALVPIFAYGPGAENFKGIYDNTEIFNKVTQLLNWNP